MTCSTMLQANLTVHSHLVALEETQSNTMHSNILSQVLSSGPLHQLPVSGKCLEFCMSFRRCRRSNTNYDLSQVTQLSWWGFR
jgi:hypothetical protein